MLPELLRKRGKDMLFSGYMVCQCVNFNERAAKNCYTWSIIIKKPARIVGQVFSLIELVVSHSFTSSAFAGASARATLDNDTRGVVG